MWAALVEEAGAAAAMCWPRSRGGGVVVVMVAPCTVGAACGESSAGRRVKGVCNEGEPDGSIVHDAKL